MYQIIYLSNQGREVIDSAPNKTEANYLLQEYRMAFDTGQVFVEHIDDDKLINELYDYSAE